MLELIKKTTNAFFRLFINQKNRQRLLNHNMSVIASNCAGAFILHDLGQKFNSPFVNLYLEPADFIKYLTDIEHYRQAKLRFLQNERHYPVAMLDDIRIYFMHYHSEQEAAIKWYERSARLNSDNLFIIMTDRDGCTYQDLLNFDRLPFKNKVVFTHKPYPEIKSAFHIHGFEKQTQVGDVFAYTGMFGRKYYDQFDYVAWFNGERMI